MPIFEVQGLDGKTYEANAPTMEQAAAAIENMTRAKPVPVLDQAIPAGPAVIPPQFRAPTIAPDAAGLAAQETGPIDAGLIAAGRTADRIWQGGADVLDMANFGDPQAQARRQERAAQQAEATRLYEPLAQQHPIATTIGASVPYFAATTSLPGMSQQAANILLPAALGALEYGTPAERAQRAGLAAGAGAAANLLARGIGGRALGDKTPYERKVFERGKELGFIPLPSEITGQRGMQVMEAKLLADPRTSDFVENIYTHNNQRLNELAAQSVGLPRGIKQLTPDVLDSAYRSVGSEFDDAAKGVTVNLGDDFLRDVLKVQDDFYEGVGRGGNRIRKTVDDLLKKAESGSMTPEEYLRQTSTLATDARSLRAKDAAKANALEDLRSALDKAFDASADVDRLPKLKAARNKWRTLITITDATDDMGNVSFQRLSTKFKKDTFGYKRGNAESELYDAVRFMKQFPKNFGRPGTAEARPAPTLLDATLKGMAAGAGTGASVGGLIGDWGTGASVGGLVGGLLGAGRHVSAPSLAHLYLSPRLNSGLIPMEQPAQDLLSQSLTRAGLLAMSPQLQAIGSP